MEEAALRFVRNLEGKKPLHLCCEADMLDFDFAPLALHAMSESTHNDEWFNVKRLCSEIVGGTVVSAAVSPWHDLRLRLDNGVLIECLIANASPHYQEEREQWVLFVPTRDHSGTFLTVYNKSGDFSGGAM